MGGDPAESIFRVMKEENGMPKLGTSATTLGIRQGKDIVSDPADRVHRPAFQPGAPNGLSCVPTIQDLPRFALPIAWGGRSNNTLIWMIAAGDLGPKLVVHEDTEPNARKRHLSIGPSGTMPYDDFVEAIEATQSKWQKVTKP
jgi:hypothetical protein